MYRYPAFALTVASFFLLPLFAQTTPPTAAKSPDELVTAPAGLRRAEPPSPTASAEELEEGGDELRAHKAYADALDYYHAGLKKSDSATLHNKAGIAELDMLHLHEAEKEFEKAIRRNHTYPEALNNLGVVYYERRNYGRAVKFYKRAIAIDKLDASFHSNLGSAYFIRRDYHNAMLEYARALELDPSVFDRTSPTGISLQLSSPQDQARFHYALAKVFATLQEPDQCLLYLRKAIEEGYPVAREAPKEQVFATMRKDPRFGQLLAESKELKLPQ